MPRKSAPVPSTWIKVSEAARRLGVSVWTVYGLARRGRLTYRRDEDTGSWRIALASVVAYDRSRTVAARAVTPEIAAQAERLPMADEPWRGSIFGRKDGRARNRRAAS